MLLGYLSFVGGNGEGGRDGHSWERGCPHPPSEADGNVRKERRGRVLPRGYPRSQGKRSGPLSGNTRDPAVDALLAPGRPFSGEVARLVPQRTSLMPELLLRDLSAEQAADLLEFLASLKDSRGGR